MFIRRKIAKHRGLLKRNKDRRKINRVKRLYYLGGREPVIKFNIDFVYKAMYRFTFEDKTDRHKEMCRTYAHTIQELYKAIERLRKSYGLYHKRIYNVISIVQEPEMPTKNSYRIVKYTSYNKKN